MARLPPFADRSWKLGLTGPLQEPKLTAMGWWWQKNQAARSLGWMPWSMGHPSPHAWANRSSFRRCGATAFGCWPSGRRMMLKEDGCGASPSAPPALLVRSIAIRPAVWWTDCVPLAKVAAWTARFAPTWSLPRLCEPRLWIEPAGKGWSTFVEPICSPPTDCAPSLRLTRTTKGVMKARCPNGTGRTTKAPFGLGCWGSSLKPIFVRQNTTGVADHRSHLVATACRRTGLGGIGATVRGL